MLTEALHTLKRLSDTMQKYLLYIHFFNKLIFMKNTNNSAVTFLPGAPQEHLNDISDSK